MGVAAWIIEKFYAWSDLDGRALDEVFSMDVLITNIMIYLVTNSFNTSTWMYHGATQEGIALPAGKKVEIPVAVVNVPKDIFRSPPRSYVDEAYNIARWTDFKHGGHFAALEVPDAMLADIQAFFPTQRHLLQKA